MTSPAALHHRICPLCEASCGLHVTVSDGQVHRIAGAPEDALSAGYLCPKAPALKELQDDPDRLRTPLVRRQGQLQAASWEEAFAEVERRLLPLIQQHGPDAVALAIGNPAAHKHSLLLYFPRLAKALGSRNVFSASTLDQMPRQLASGWLYGHWFTVPVPDIDRTDLLVLLGANPMASNGSMWTVPDFRGRAKALKARGGRLVVIDPRHTETAALADQHLPLLPGADVYLLAALVHTLWNEGLVNTGRLGPWLAGLDDLPTAFVPFAPERVAQRCGLAASDIRELARSLARTPRASVYGRIGTCTQRFGTTVSWLIDLVNLLTGHLDEVGGAMFPQAPAFAANTQGTPGRGRGIRTGRHHGRSSGAPEVFGELPISTLAEEIDTPGPGQVRALITVATNPVLSCPGSQRLEAALGQLDFMVSLDIYLNETTCHADVVLPGVPALQDSHYDVAFHQLACRNVARASAPVLPLEAGLRPEWQVLQTLAAIVAGQGAAADVQALDDAALRAELAQLPSLDPTQRDQLWQAVSAWSGPDRLVDLALRLGPHGDALGQRPGGLTLAQLRATPAGLDLGALAPRLPDALRTPSGRVELAPAACMADLQHAWAVLDDPMPAWWLIGRRHVRSNNSWMHNLPSLAKGPERCTLLVNPADAEREGLKNGDPVRLWHGPRSLVCPVEISASVRTGVLSLPHGWGHHRPGSRLQVAAQRPGANLNQLLDEGARDPLSGTSVLSGVAVRLERLAVA